MGSRYKDFLKILAKCPLDPTKGDRDVGQHIRNCIKLAFNTEKGFTGDSNLCDRQYLSLKRISDNYYGNLYKREKVSSSSGLTAADCNSLLSSESLEYLDDDQDGFFQRLMKKNKN